MFVNRIRMCCSIFLLLFVFSTALHATELTLDDHLPVSQVLAHDMPDNHQVANLSVEPVSTAQEGMVWWLYAGVFLLLMTCFFLLWKVWPALKKAIKVTHVKRKWDIEPEPVDLSDVEAAALRAAEVRRIVDEPKLIAKTPSKPRATVREVSDVLTGHDLQDAYAYHYAGNSEKMLEVMNKAFQYDAFDMHVYDLAMRILSESDKPAPELLRLFRTGLFLLHSKRPMMWKEVAKKGRVLLPNLEDWHLEAEL